MNINSDVSLLNSRVVYDLTPFSHLDFPNHLSCIVWIAECGLRCKYCYNQDIVFAKNGKLSFNDVLSFLDKRTNLLDGVVLSGGEATGVDLIEFCELIKSKGFKIKLDTNGVNFKYIKELIELNLIDYIALDYKAPKYKFKKVTDSTISQFNLFEKTLNYLIRINFDFEIRTTLHRDLLNEDDINSIINNLTQKGYNGEYFLQKFLDTGSNIGNIQSSDKDFNFKSIQTKNSNIDIKYRY